MDDVRSLIIGGDEKFVENIVRRNAKGMVSDVVSEALNERESQDGSVNKVLVPLIEKSLHRSVEANSDKIVGALYPLVGSLIRKAVSAFLIEFIERTNTLIEHSFSAKSVKWRFKAWRSGVPYSDYVASQIYQYQVHQVLAIHRETGTLLNSVTSHPGNAKDGDLISSMLVAISDFVADAFSQDNQAEETELGEIKTDDFTLLIKVGPQVILVAAVSGHVSPRMRHKLQDTLEEFHRFYQSPLQKYQGDNGPFATSDAMLQECLISEQKTTQEKKKRAGAGVFILAGLLVVAGYLAFLRIDLAITSSTIAKSEPPAGIVMLNTRTDGNQIILSVLRDPAATGVAQWLAGLDIDSSVVDIKETPFESKDDRLIPAKIQQLTARFPALTFTNGEQPALSGTISTGEWQRFLRALHSIAGIETVFPDTTKVVLEESTPVNDALALNALAGSLATTLSGYTLFFDMNQSRWSKANDATIGDIAQTIINLQNIAEQSGQTLSVFILGGSDNSGTSVKNMLLSESRAQSVKQALTKAGVEHAVLHTKGLGQLDLARGSNSRMVFFHALLTPAEAGKGKKTGSEEGNRQ